MKCNCCGRELKSNNEKCNYCGFDLNKPILLDDAGEKQYQGVINNYRENLVGKISEVFVNAYSYKWNEANNALEESGSQKIVVASGEKAYNKIAWSAEKFGQNLDDLENERELEIHYVIGGVDKKQLVSILPIQCNDFWSIGIEITSTLSLVIHLGTTENYSSSKEYEIDFS